MDVTLTDEMRSLKGKDFVLYCLYDHPNKEFRNIVHTLFYAVVYDMDKTERYIRRLIHEPNKSLIYYYPAFDKKDKIIGKELVGSILDGAVYWG